MTNDNQPATEELVSLLQSVLDIIQSRFLGLVIAIGGVLTALAWDEVFKELFNHYFGDIDSLGGKALYALLLTMLVFLVTKIAGKKKKVQ